MRGDMPQAAFRALVELGSRTHFQKEFVRKRKPLRPDGKKWNAARPLRIRGREFESAKQARKALHLSEMTIRRMIARGTATYL